MSTNPPPPSDAEQRDENACIWCGKHEAEHAAPAPMIVGPTQTPGLGRLCPVPGVTSQYFSPWRGITRRRDELGEWTFCEHSWRDQYMRKFTNYQIEHGGKNVCVVQSSETARRIVNSHNAALDAARREGDEARAGHVLVPRNLVEWAAECAAGRDVWSRRRKEFQACLADPALAAPPASAPAGSEGGEGEIIAPVRFSPEESKSLGDIRRMLRASADTSVAFGGSAAPAARARDAAGGGEVQR